MTKRIVQGQTDVASTWDKVARSYDEECYWSGPENHANLSALLDHIGDPHGKRIMEVGCGSGFTSLALARQGALCALLDISEASLDVAVGAFTESGVPAPERYLEDALNSSVPSDEFDIVWNGGVIEHFPDEGKERLILEMLRMIRPGGRVIILVPNAWCLPFMVKQRILKLRKKWPYGFEDDMSPLRLRRMCERLGLKDFTTYAFNPVLGWRWFSKIRKLIKPLGLDTVENHRKRSWMGFVSVLVIGKEGS